MRDDHFANQEKVIKILQRLPLPNKTMLKTKRNSSGTGVEIFRALPMGQVFKPISILLQTSSSFEMLSMLRFGAILTGT